MESPPPPPPRLCGDLGSLMRQAPLTSQVLPRVQVPTLRTRPRYLHTAGLHPGAETAPPLLTTPDLLFRQLKSQTPLWLQPLPDPLPSTSDSQLAISALRLGLGKLVPIDPPHFVSGLRLQTTNRRLLGVGVTVPAPL